MKICVAQTQSKSNNVDYNIRNHISLIHRAIHYQVDLIIFPELSLTNYEPKLSKELAFSADDERLNSFQELSNRHEISIGIGVPIKSNNGVHIGLLFFQPNQERNVYFKQYLHKDEEPFFAKGTEQLYLTIKGIKLGFGICYETLNEDHFLKCFNNNIDVYIASVAKSQSALNRAFFHLENLSSSYKIPILMSNAVGPCHDFISAGQTACWNRNGVILAKLDAANQGVVCYDVSISQTRIEQLRISQASIFHLDDVFEIYNSAKKHMQSKGLQQWVEEYPVKSDIQKDIVKGELYILLKDSQIIGAINISDEQDEEYRQINWKFDDSKVLVIHRLAILPEFQQKGYARYLMDFAENHALEHQYTSIRLDAYTLNHRVAKFYEQRGYIIRGEVYFPFRQIPFYGLEKQLSY